MPERFIEEINEHIATETMPRVLHRLDVLKKAARAYLENPASIEARNALAKALGENP